MLNGDLWNEQEIQWKHQKPPYVSKAAPAADGNNWKMIYHEFQARKEEAHLHGKLSCGWNDKNASTIARHEVCMEKQLCRWYHKS